MLTKRWFQFLNSAILRGSWEAKICLDFTPTWTLTQTQEVVCFGPTNIDKPHGGRKGVLQKEMPHCQPLGRLSSPYQVKKIVLLVYPHRILNLTAKSCELLRSFEFHSSDIIQVWILDYLYFLNVTKWAKQLRKDDQFWTQFCFVLEGGGGRFLFRKQPVLGIVYFNFKLLRAS